MSSASAPAWQPLTFGGVAGFARSTFGRLFLVQCVVAGLVALSVGWTIFSCWAPVIESAVTELPEGAAIRRGRLQWPGAEARRLAESSYLSIAVAPPGTRSADHSADLQLELGANELRFRSLLGYLAVPYPRDRVVGLSRSEAAPWWGAWRPFLIPAVVLAVLAGLAVGWILLAVLYSIPVGLIAFYLDRAVTMGGCLRLAGAALLPGAVLMGAAILLYSFHRLSLPGLIFAWLLHVLVGWVYAVVSPLRLPSVGGGVRRRGNPFGRMEKPKKRA